MTRLLEVLCSPLTWGLAGGVWFVSLFLPVVPVYKGGAEPEFYWALGSVYLLLLSQPDWLEGWAWVGGHVLLSLMVGTGLVFGLLFLMEWRDSGRT